MNDNNNIVLSVILPKKLKISLQEIAPSTPLVDGKRGASGLVLTILRRFEKEDGTIDREKLEKFLDL